MKKKKNSNSPYFAKYLNLLINFPQMNFHFWTSKGKPNVRMQSQLGWILVTGKLRVDTLLPYGLTRFLAMQFPRPLTFGALCDSLGHFEMQAILRPVWLTAFVPLQQTTSFTFLSKTTFNATNVRFQLFFNVEIGNVETKEMFRVRFP